MGDRKSSTGKILLVDDESSVLESFTTALESDGITNTFSCRDGRDVLGILQETAVELILLDLAMPHVRGLELLKDIRNTHPEIPVIIVTGTNEVATAVDCMRAGACDYMVKAVEPSRLISGVRRALEIRGLRRQLEDLQSTLLSDQFRCPEAFSDLVTRDDKFRRCLLVAESFSLSSEPILILGETGVGKNMLAAAIHRASGRDGRFVEVNVGGLEDTNFADTLFGHRKGAFTGADLARSGMVAEATGGTILLDEIADLSISCQVKLLQFLDKREYYPLGADLPKRSDARVIVATNRELVPLMRTGQFRKDLYYRFGTHTIVLPPLRERRKDIAPLLAHFLEEAATKRGISVPEVPAEELRRLTAREFPGNVREIRNLAWDAIGRYKGDSLSFSSAADGLSLPADALKHGPPASTLVFPETLPTPDQARDALYEEAMRRANYNQSGAARLLGVTHTAVYNWLKKRDQTAGEG